MVSSALTIQKTLDQHWHDAVSLLKLRCRPVLALSTEHCIRACLHEVSNELKRDSVAGSDDNLHLERGDLTQ